jgi:rSAM/selenodomain-associated transferase 1
MPLKSALGIFFRSPALGKVKKRLAYEIGEDAALKAYESMLNATIENVSKLKGIDIYGFYEGEIISLNFRMPSDNPPIPPLEKGGKGGFEKEWILDLLKKLPLVAQEGGNLGERMYKAIQWLFDKGYQKVLLIGTDSPDLPLFFIKEAFQKLDSYELVIGPSEDGGYYLIGMKEPLEMVFKNIEWGNNTVLKDTILHAHTSKKSYFLLSEWYDIDDFNTLNRWRLNKGLQANK